MSIQKDFILRMIEMMGDLIAALLSKIKKGETKIAEEQLAQYYGDFLKNDAAFFRNLPIDSMTDTLLNEHNYTNQHLIILAELFYVEGELQEAKEDITSSNLYYMKALKLYRFIDAALKTYDETRNERMKILKLKIGR